MDPKKLELSFIRGVRKGRNLEPIEGRLFPRYILDIDGNLSYHLVGETGTWWPGPQFHQDSLASYTSCPLFKQKPCVRTLKMDLSPVYPFFFSMCSPLSHVPSVSIQDKGCSSFIPVTWIKHPGRGTLLHMWPAVTLTAYTKPITSSETKSQHGWGGGSWSSTPSWGAIGSRCLMGVVGRYSFPQGSASWEATLAPEDGPAPVQTEAAVSRFSGKKREKEERRGREEQQEEEHGCAPALGGQRGDELKGRK